LTNKILNDPLYGLLRLESALVVQLLDHRLVQRLRYIRQLGMTYLVYPGATHSRLAHALGAMHLMQEALDILGHKGYPLSSDDRTGALCAILLHDLGHAPFSHALEGHLVRNLSHEDITLLLMHDMNQGLDGALETAIDVFSGKHEIPFLHQLVSSQLDMDRLDYLNRDSFFTGVTEGVIGVDRILNMLDVHYGSLVVDRKGVYSIEKYLMARNLMYWQVYLHKTVLSAEYLMGHILRRACECLAQGLNLWISEDLGVFLKGEVDAAVFESEPSIRHAYARLDDSEITVHLKAWSLKSEPLLEHLCGQLIHRKLSKVVLTATAPDSGLIYEQGLAEAKRLGLGAEAIPYLAHSNTVSNPVYSGDDQPILIRDRQGHVCPLEQLQDHVFATDLKAHRRLFALYLPKN